MSKKRERKPADELKGAVWAGDELACPASKATERIAAGDSELNMDELKNIALNEILALFEGDETSAREWMKRTRPFLGNVTPEEMLDSAENIRRLRRFVQQIERGVFP